MYIRPFHTFLMAVGLLCMMACNRQSSDGVLTRQEMADVLYDYHLAQALVGNRASFDTLGAQRYTDMVLAKHGISQAEFDSSLLWYSRNSDEFYEVYKTINERIDKELGIVNQPSEEKAFATTGDTANIWTGKTTYLLMPTAYANAMHFTQANDTALHAQDRIEWRFNTDFAYTNGNLSAIALLAIRYDNDSIGTVVNRIYGNSAQTLTLVAANRPAKAVYGQIYLDEPVDNSNKLLLLSKMMLIRYKHQPLPTDSVPLTLPADSLRKDSSAQQTTDTAKQTS